MSMRVQSSGSPVHLAGEQSYTDVVQSTCEKKCPLRNLGVKVSDGVRDSFAYIQDLFKHDRFLSVRNLRVKVSNVVRRAFAYMQDLFKQNRSLPGWNEHKPLITVMKKLSWSQYQELKHAPFRAQELALGLLELNKGSALLKTTPILKRAILTDQATKLIELENPASAAPLARLMGALHNYSAKHPGHRVSMQDAEAIFSASPLSALNPTSVDSYVDLLNALAEQREDLLTLDICRILNRGLFYRISLLGLLQNDQSLSHERWTTFCRMITSIDEAVQLTISSVLISQATGDNLEAIGHPLDLVTMQKFITDYTSDVTDLLGTASAHLISFQRCLPLFLSLARARSSQNFTAEERAQLQDSMPFFLKNPNVGRGMIALCSYYKHRVPLLRDTSLMRIFLQRVHPYAEDADFQLQCAKFDTLSAEEQDTWVLQRMEKEEERENRTMYGNKSNDSLSGKPSGDTLRSSSYAEATDEDTCHVRLTIPTLWASNFL